MGRKNKDLDLPIVSTNSGSGKGVLIAIIIILLICCLGLGGYIVYTKFIFKEETPTVKNTSDALKEVKIDGNHLLEVEDIINAFEYAYNDSFSNFYGYIYSAKAIKASTFDKDAALFACVYPYLDESMNVSYVANNTVRTNFKAIFGSEVEYKPNNISAGTGYDIKYDPTLKYFSYQRIGIGGYFYPTFVTYNESCTVSDEKIEVVKRVGFIEYSDDHTKVNIYADKNKTKPVGVLSVTDGSFNKAEIKDKYLSSLSQYKYTFVNEKNSFVFEMIERTN